MVYKLPEINNENHVAMKDLTLNQIKWCHAYISNNQNISKTCEIVGITRTTAYSYLKQDKIKNYIQILTELGTKENIASTQELLQVLSDISMGKQNDQVVDFKSGRIVEVIPSAISRIKSIELIMKYRGELNQKVEINQNNLYLNAPSDRLDLTSLIENKEVKQIPIDIPYEVIGGEDDGE